MNPTTDAKIVQIVKLLTETVQRADVPWRQLNLNSFGLRREQYRFRLSLLPRSDFPGRDFVLEIDQLSIAALYPPVLAKKVPELGEDVYGLAVLWNALVSRFPGGHITGLDNVISDLQRSLIKTDDASQTKGGDS